MIVMISIVLALAVIAVAASLENRVRVAAPILLVLRGAPEKALEPEEPSAARF